MSVYYCSTYYKAVREGVKIRVNRNFGPWQFAEMAVEVQQNVGRCGVRRARATTATVVPSARYMCPRAVEAPGACAARSGCHKLRTVPAATLQRRPAGARRRRVT